MKTRLQAPTRAFLLILFISFTLPLFSYSQTFFGVSSTPADNAAQAGPIVIVAPPASMVAGDLVVIYAHYRANGAALAIATTGGQTWTAETTNSGGTQTYSVFWCRYNGLWAANPSVTVGAGVLGLSAVMYVYRPVNSNSAWGINVTAVNSNSGATTNTITGITTTAPRTVTMAFWGNPTTTSGWNTLAGAGWSKTGLGAQYRNITGGQSNTAAYNIRSTAGAVANVSQNQLVGNATRQCILAWFEKNDDCAAAYPLTSGTTCTNITGSLFNSNSTAGVPGACGNASSADVWYSFTAQTAYPTITLSSIGASFNTASPRIQLLSGSCGVWTSLSCVSGTSLTTTALNGGAGLAPGTTYFIRIATNTNTGVPTGGYAAWDFDICITDPATSRIEYSRSYINITKGSTGGTVSVGDTLEMRATLVIFNNSADSLAFYDTLYKNGGLQLIPGTIALRTNEGLIYRKETSVKAAFTDDSTDADAGYWRRPNGLDTVIRINFGAGATRVAKGLLASNSQPTIFGNTCIIMATYRVRVYAPYNTKINFKTGSLSYRDVSTGVYSNTNFVRDSLIVYQSPGLCPNAVSATNAIGIESNGTFGAPVTAPPLIRNKSSVYVLGYGYFPFGRFDQNTGPQDYYYSIANNTFASTYTTANTWAKVESAAPYHRLFGHWDVSGDHTGATNQLKGNNPCDTTLPVSASNPCGYMLVVNSAFKTDTVFQYNVTGLCPNTYYEIAAWFKNICAKCGGDSTGKSYNAVGYVPSALNDSSGVKPNIAFDVNGTDYYTTGNISYVGTAAAGRDSANRWVRRGFTYLTGASETSFQLTFRNNAPGGGGNDWAMDDISVNTCLPAMKYSPSLTPNVCRMNPLTINDTVRSYFDNYVYYKWQRSTDNGVNWSDVTAALGPAIPTWNGTAWEYVTSYTIPPSATDTSDSGDRYRLIVATTSANLSNINCQLTDGVSIINLTVNNCGTPLKTDLLSFNGKLVVDKSNLSWTTSKEDEPVIFDIERSNDGNIFTLAGSVSSHNNYSATVNTYSFIDPSPVTGKVFYRLVMKDQSGMKKYSRTIQLSRQGSENFGLVNVINPFNYSLEFDVTSPGDAKIEVELLDMFGRAVQKNSFLIHTGINALSLPNTENLPAGTYIFRIKNNEVLINRKVLKKSY